MALLAESPWKLLALRFLLAEIDHMEISSDFATHWKKSERARARERERENRDDMEYGAVSEAQRRSFK